MGFSWYVALWDAVISNILLGFACAVIITIPSYYLPRKNRYVILIAWSLAISGLWLLAARFFLQLSPFGGEEYRIFLENAALLRFWISALVVSWVGILGVLWTKLEEERESEKRRREAEGLARDAELFKLRHQLQPHFLFNSLNSINALIGTQPAEARKMINKLSDFLRSTLKKEEHQWVSLDEELQHLQLYLEIEKLRFGHRLLTSIEIDESATSLDIPPMLLQPVVENAIKFGLYDTTGETLITIRVNSEENYLKITVQNPFDPETSSPRQGTGFGLNSVQRRLSLLFARTDLLSTSAHNNLFTTVIKIPWHDKSNTD